MSNRLATESSPYLLQHRDNPVDWYPWGAEALDLAKRENKPIFLSIGYSACHWCHVMEHESFESEEIARALNAQFVCIKVDREERPDLDQVYMNAVQMLTGRGGWPMSVFLTPDLKPFYGGTYWPPQSRHGMPGFDQIIEAVARAWNDNHEAVIETADQLANELAHHADQSSGIGELSTLLIDKAMGHFRQTFDRTFGGFGGAPKFPAPMSLRLLLRYWHRQGESYALEMVRHTLDRMAAGGIYDHLGGGFSRYSVDARWLVPHFEKMLYDNAQLALAYLEAHQVTGRAEYAHIVRETLDYVLRDMTDPAGGFYSTEDADSEGVEGKFYTWTPNQVAEVLEESEAKTFARIYDISEAGNFEGTNILNLRQTLKQQAQTLGRDLQDLQVELAESHAKLFTAREQRVHPHKDDKVIVAWNALMIEAMATAGAVLCEPRYIDAAVKAADFIDSELRREGGRLCHTWRHGKAKGDAFLDDYGYLACALITLYEATRTSKYLTRASEIIDLVIAHFADQEQGGFYYTGDDQEQLLVRSKEYADNAVPSGNAMAALALVKLAKLTGDDRYRSIAERTMQACVALMQRYPSGMAQMLLAVDLYLGRAYELVFAGNGDKESSDVLKDLHNRFLPHIVLAYAESNDVPAIAELLAGKSMIGGLPTLYLCEGFTCRAPATGKEEISQVLRTIAAKDASV